MDILKATTATNGPYHLNLLCSISDRAMEMPLIYGNFSASLYSTSFEMLDTGQSSNSASPKTPYNWWDISLSVIIISFR